MERAEHVCRPVLRACVTVRRCLAPAAILLLVVTVASAAGAAPSAVAVAEQYLSAWQTGDAGRMYALLAEDAKRQVSREEFSEAFSVRLPYGDQGYLTRPVRFDHVRLRSGSSGLVDYRAVFTVGSLLGPSAARVFCRDSRDAADWLDLHRARKQGLYLLYDHLRADSPYLRVGYVLAWWDLLVLQDATALLPSEVPRPRYRGVVPRVGLEANWELSFDTATLATDLFQVSARARPFGVAALQVTKEGRIGLPFAPREGGSAEQRPLDEEDFDRLISLMDLDRW